MTPPLSCHHVVAQPRFLGIDEGTFTFDEDEVVVVGVLTRGASTVEAVVTDRVTVDGWDATETVIGMARRLPGSGAERILIDGITLGGMNLVDLQAVAAALRVPVLGITRRRPGPSGLAHAAERAADPPRRKRNLPEHPPVEVRLGGATLFVQAAGPGGQTLEPDRLTETLRPAMAQSRLPEPLRLAHHIATAIVRGVSGTPA